MSRFADISIYNASFDADVYKDAGHELIVIKATEGATYTNERWEGWVKDARHTGLRVGHYHFATTWDAADQAAHFLNVVNRNYHPDDILILDLEQAAIPARRRGDLARDFLGKIDHMPGEKWLYSGKFFLQEGRVSYFGVPLWLPSYTNTWRDSMLPHGWDKETLVAWQFTATATVPGVGKAAGGVDYSEWYPTTPQPGNRFAGYPTLHRGDQDSHRTGTFPDRGAPVQTLQNALNIVLGWEGGHPSRLAPDGDFGPATHEGVVHYQGQRGLTADGVVGTRTWSRLDSDLDTIGR
ncbi:MULTISPECIES: GH25 family lysozyme [unclassified Frankia]|uniref:GH25 family lysozyme n=1 Tax=unclassified Frankia TaxID=2632575 RepID=UPI0020252BF0